MDKNSFKKYTIKARRGIRGEAFFESLICNNSIPHHIVGSKDLGIDYFCEWVHDDKPTGVLFAVQVKTFSETTTTKPKFVCIEEGYNYLEKYEIHNSNLNIDSKTRLYWQSFGLPLYLFAIVQSNNKGAEQLNCYYKRYTQILNKHNYNYYDKFYKVNEDDTFIAFKKPGVCGFARDLFFDYVHLCYAKGQLSYIDPHTFGLTQFKDEVFYKGIFNTYKLQVRAAYEKTEKYLEKFDNQYLNKKN